MSDVPELYADREEKYARVIHAESNAILNAGQSLKGWTLYTWPFPPCERCSVQVIQVGIARVVSFFPNEDAKERWGASMVRGRRFFTEANVVTDYYPRHQV
jgi:dCMP deaminase